METSTIKYGNKTSKTIKFQKKKQVGRLEVRLSLKFHCTNPQLSHHYNKP
jgi:hypothetical protein